MFHVRYTKEKEDGNCNCKREKGQRKNEVRE